MVRTLVVWRSLTTVFIVFATKGVSRTSRPLQRSNCTPKHTDWLSHADSMLRHSEGSKAETVDHGDVRGST